VAGQDHGHIVVVVAAAVGDAAREEDCAAVQQPGSGAILRALHLAEQIRELLDLSDRSLGQLREVVGDHAVMGDLVVAARHLEIRIGAPAESVVDHEGSRRSASP